MRAINLKLARELWGMRGQALAIAFVIAGGIATWLISATTLDSLERTRDSFYTGQRFAQVFATLKRAPERMGRRIASIPGARAISTRVVAISAPSRS